MEKIVIIDDNRITLNEVMGWLQFEGYEVTGAVDGKLGLEAIRQEIPDLIVCDIAMPEANGHEVLIEVRSDRTLNHIPFVFLTNATDPDSVRMGMNLGADDYLKKPVTSAEILNAIRSRLDKQATQDTQAQSLINLLNLAFSEEREKRLVKSRMVAMFSHDFRNPLASILMSAHLIRRYKDRLSPERKAEHFDRIDGAVHLLTQMLDDMLMVADLEDGHVNYKPQSIKLAALVEAIVEEFRLIVQNSHKLTVHATLQNWIQADSKLLRQMLVNLISNAIKYSPPGGEVTITLSEDNGRINLSVQDQGIGIPEDSLSHLFEPFYRATNVEDVQGTGLGLSIVKSCIECHDGHIEVVSEVGKGTTFVVELPLVIA